MSLKDLMERHGSWDARDLHIVSALAPDAVALLIDMAAWIHTETGAHLHYLRRIEAEALLARFASLDQRATT